MDDFIHSVNHSGNIKARPLTSVRFQYWMISGSIQEGVIVTYPLDV